MEFKDPKLLPPYPCEQELLLPVKLPYTLAFKIICRVLRILSVCLHASPVHFLPVSPSLTHSLTDKTAGRDSSFQISYGSFMCGVFPAHRQGQKDDRMELEPAPRARVSLLQQLLLRPF